jgi:signal transduction histidine kinase
MKESLSVFMGRWRSAGIVVLLVAAICLVAALALQAQYASRFHRQAAESVLQDYARVVAEEFIRRTSGEIGYRGYYSAITALQKRLSSPGQPDLPAPEDLVGTLDGRGRPAGELARSIFTMDPSSGEMRTTGEPFDADSRRWILDSIQAELASETTDRAPFSALHGSGDGSQRTIIYAVFSPSGEEKSLVTGFEVNINALSEWFQRVVERGPLLPKSLGDGDLSNDLLYLKLADSEGRQIFKSGDYYDPTLTTYTPLGDTYSGIFEGMTLQAAIHPNAAPRLVIGGLPRSRLPVLIGLLVLTIGLLLAAIYQMRRERALARMRSEFVSRVSHELRTPLTQIRMFAETLLLGRARTVEERRRSLEILDQEARRLSHLVENILQFSRGDRGAIRLAPRPVELAALLTDMVEKFQPIARARQVSVVPQFADQIVCLVDDDAMRQVVINLLDNAVKYGPAGQEVRLGLEAGAGCARIWIDDEGPGIPERDREKIWVRWQRLEKHERAAIAGTGIGLTVVRDLITLQGGRAWVERGDRGGARFVVELPLMSEGPAGTSPRAAEVRRRTA